MTTSVPLDSMAAAAAPHSPRFSSSTARQRCGSFAARLLRSSVEGFTLVHGPSAGGDQDLVVEDDDDSREVLAQGLTIEGATVTAVSTAADALPLLPGSDIVLTDYALPNDDGVWLLEHVNKQPRPVPVIAISGYDESQEPRLATALFAGKLLKSFDHDRLCAEIALAVGGRA
jgi:CheY-like chemotaxis protein